MDNLKLYHALRRVPDDAKRPIQAGRLKGKTDINPMWRLKSLTEQFGPCGIGWKYVIEQQWMEPGSDGEMAAFCNISLYIKNAEGQWSDAIPGTGGSAFIAKERSGLYTSDECYKMALTDAISVACKALGTAIKKASCWTSGLPSHAHGELKRSRAFCETRSISVTWYRAAGALNFMPESRSGCCHGRNGRQ